MFPIAHPSVRLLLWATAVLALQRIPPVVLFAVLLIAAAGGGDVLRRRWWRLAYRSRWLLGVLALTFLCSTPGEALIAGYWPTWEGLQAGAAQCLRIVAVLGAVAWLLATTPVERLVAGIYGIALWARRGQPSRGHADRAAVRLALVLRYAEESREAHWRDLLRPLEPATLDPVTIDLPPLARADRVWLGMTLLALLVMATFALWGGA